MNNSNFKKDGFSTYVHGKPMAMLLNHLQSVEVKEHWWSKKTTTFYDHSIPIDTLVTLKFLCFNPCDDLEEYTRTDTLVLWVKDTIDLVSQLSLMTRNVRADNVRFEVTPLLGTLGRHKRVIVATLKKKPTKKSIQKDLLDEVLELKSQVLELRKEFSEIHKS